MRFDILLVVNVVYLVVASAVRALGYALQMQTLILIQIKSSMWVPVDQRVYLISMALFKCWVQGEN